MSKTSGSKIKDDEQEYQFSLPFFSPSGHEFSFYDTPENERLVIRHTSGSHMEFKADGSEGGVNLMKVYGNTIIQNDDENGGITIASKGYLNLVAGQERVDLTGKFTDTPSDEAIGTFTNLVFKPEEKELDVSKKPGDYIMKTDAGAYYQYGKETKGSSEDEERGLFQEVTKGDMWQEIVDGKRQRKVKKEEEVKIEDDQTIEVKGDRKRKVEGDEKVEIEGTQTIKAKKIFLN